MVSVAGVNRKTYQERFGRGQPLEALACPDPSCLGGSLGGHGFQRRYVDGSYMELRRVRCRRCRVTHVVLPEDLCAYRDVSFQTLEKILSTPGGPTALPLVEEAGLDLVLLAQIGDGDLVRQVAAQDGGLLVGAEMAACSSAHGDSFRLRSVEQVEVLFQLKQYNGWHHLHMQFTNGAAVS